MKKNACLLAGLMMATSVFAGKDLVCPDLEALKMPIDFSQYNMIAPDTAYYYMGMSKFNTDKLWVIFVAPVMASSSNDVTNAAEKILGQISSPGVIKYSKELDDYYCSYETNNNTYVNALAPDMDNLSARTNPLKSLKKFILKQ